MGILGFGKKKEKATCPICGKEIGLLDGKMLADQTLICEDCEEKLRLRYQQGFVAKRNAFGDVKYNQDGFVKKRLADDLSLITLEEAREALAEIEEESAALVSELGGDFSNIFTVGTDSFLIAPKAMTVGLPRSKKLKNTMVVDGLVVSGSFDRGQDVTLVIGGQKIPAQIVEAHKKSVVDFVTTLGANGKQGINAGENGWLILATTEKIPKGATIGR